MSTSTTAILPSSIFADVQRKRFRVKLIKITNINGKVYFVNIEYIIHLTTNQDGDTLVVVDGQHGLNGCLLIKTHIPLETLIKEITGELK